MKIFVKCYYKFKVIFINIGNMFLIKIDMYNLYNFVDWLLVIVEFIFIKKWFEWLNRNDFLNMRMENVLGGIFFCL